MPTCKTFGTLGLGDEHAVYVEFYHLLGDQYHAQDVMRLTVSRNLGMGKFDADKRGLVTRDDPTFASVFAQTVCDPLAPGYFTNASGGAEACPPGTAAGAQFAQNLRYFELSHSSSASRHKGFDSIASSSDSSPAAASSSQQPDSDLISSGWKKNPDDGVGGGGGGLVFDGRDDHVVLEPWAMGGDASVEVYFKPGSFFVPSWSGLRRAREEEAEDGEDTATNVAGFPPCVQALGVGLRRKPASLVFLPPPASSRFA